MPNINESPIWLITGCSSGLGRALAEHALERGDRVAVTARDRAAVTELAARYGDRALALELDVTDPASVTAAVQACERVFGRIDVLVNNAGIVRDAQLVKWKDGAVAATMSDEQWRAVLDVNLTGVFNCTRAVAPHMIRAGRGVILSASSVVGLYGNFGQTNYVATKAGVIGLTRTWARELGRHGIRVNAVAPGFVATEIVSAMPDKVKEAMVARTPIGRMGAPEDIAEAYFWLASDCASFVHGAVLSVDGGLVVGT
jgi:3-oxoacyl-[acyl-carrier protein] reductase